MVESTRFESIRLESSVVYLVRLTGKSICETLRKKSHKKANREGRKSGRFMLSSCRSFRVQILQIDNTSEGEGSLQFSCLVSHHALRTRKVHVIFLSFRVQILQIDNTSEEEGSLQCSCLVSTSFFLPFFFFMVYTVMSNKTTS